MSIAPSLFDAQGGALTAAADWLTGTLFGGLAAALCVIAVAFVGLVMMTGRLAIRDGLKVTIGCFVLLGAPAVAAGLRGVGEGIAEPGEPVAPLVMQAPAPVNLPPANYDPYAGASLLTN